MFNAKLEAKLWRDIVNTVSSIIEEAPFEVKEQGIYMRAMDPSHISMLDIEIPKEMFDEFSVDKEISLGIDMDEMRKIMNRSKPSDILIMNAEESRIHMTFIGESKRKFGLPIIDILEKRSKLPEIPFTATVELNSEIFQDGIKDASVVADHITFEAKKDNFLIKAQGDTSDIETVNEKDSMIEYDVKEDAKATFNLSYLSDISKSIYGTMVIKLGSDVPLLLEFEIDKAKVKFILAPRIERE
ncbi:MAG: proliferating cell nuclear antigen (pcna) [Methanomicrobia archaeon]|jgi:proliferating cell nuclear antigen|nr:proliferating cell nuclear antigen (pcna) [Methanomicrobia archaeon]MCK4637505.1 proliferating cell nuclear antigen (pcna) [Methanomicrobia archaeon]